MICNCTLVARYWGKILLRLYSNSNPRKSPIITDGLQLSVEDAIGLVCDICTSILRTAYGLLYESEEGLHRENLAIMAAACASDSRVPYRGMSSMYAAISWRPNNTLIWSGDRF